MSMHIDDLRRRLFQAIDGVVSGTTSVEQARQISDLAQVVVNSAKVEVDYLRATGGGESHFIDADSARRLPDPVDATLRSRLGGSR